MLTCGGASKLTPKTCINEGLEQQIVGCNRCVTAVAFWAVNWAQKPRRVSMVNL
jgi:hypothetical protein